LPEAETTLEGTYRWQVAQGLFLQPDLQYVIHPAAAHGLPNALVVGLRIIGTANAPAGAVDNED
jgi:porin